MARENNVQWSIDQKFAQSLHDLPNQFRLAQKDESEDLFYGVALILALSLSIDVDHVVL